MLVHVVRGIDCELNDLADNGAVVCKEEFEGTVDLNQLLEDTNCVECSFDVSILMAETSDKLSDHGHFLLVEGLLHLALLFRQ